MRTVGKHGYVLGCPCLVFLLRCHVLSLFPLGFLIFWCRATLLFLAGDTVFLAVWLQTSILQSAEMHSKVMTEAHCHMPTLTLSFTPSSAFSSSIMALISRPCLKAQVTWYAVLQVFTEHWMHAPTLSRHRTQISAQRLCCKQKTWVYLTKQLLK